MQDPIPPLEDRPRQLDRLRHSLPCQCAVCCAWTRHAICDHCLQRYARPTLRCGTCGLRLPQPLAGHRALRCGRCLVAPPPLDQTVAAFDYQFPWDGLLQRFKFQRELSLGAGLAEQVGARIDQAGAPAPDWVLPVPLSPERLRERGYNQAHELAKVLARRRGLRVDAHLLLRLRHRPQQATLSLEERAANTRGVFALEPTRAAEVANCRVALVDDVMTTGATLFELANVLRRAGAREVHAWVVARTPEPGS